MQVDFCFVISDLLSTTPRAHRAIEALLETGKSVCLVYNARRKYAIAQNDFIIASLRQRFPAQFDARCIAWSRKRFRDLLYKGIHRILSTIDRYVRFRSPFFVFLLADYCNLPQYFLARNIRAQVFVGHRPATVPLISRLAKGGGALSWFDIEDFHLEESVDVFENERIKRIVQPFAIDFYTTAARQIGERYLAILAPTHRATEILNSPLPAEQTNEKGQHDQRPVFIWYSQYVTYNRGLEVFFEALTISRIPGVVHLIGDCDVAFRQYVETLQHNPCEVHFHGYLHENTLMEMLALSDIGLALEPAHRDVSRDLSITNKIVAYAVAGCYILATKTSGQLDFLSRLPECGILTGYHADEMAKILQQLTDQLQALRESRIKRSATAQPVSWPIQKVRLLEALASHSNQAGIEILP